MGDIPILGKKRNKSTDQQELERLIAEQISMRPSDPEALARVVPVELPERPQADLVEKTKGWLDTLPEPEPLQGTLGRQELFFIDELYKPGANVEPVPEADRGVLQTETPFSIPQMQVVGETQKIVSDGGSTGYYDIPAGATELNDLIEHKHMGFALANIFKACYRLGQKDGTDLLYDLNKIVYFAEKRLIPYVKKHGKLP